MKILATSFTVQNIKINTGTSVRHHSARLFCQKHDTGKELEQESQRKPRYNAILPCEVLSVQNNNDSAARLLENTSINWHAGFKGLRAWTTFPTFNDAEVVVDDLGEGGQAVSGAGGVGHHLVAALVFGMVHALPKQIKNVTKNANCLRDKYKFWICIAKNRVMKKREKKCQQLLKHNHTTD